MSELQVIENTLARAARRRRMERALRGLWQGLLVGAGIWLLTLAIYKLAPIPLSALTVAAIAGLAAAPIGFLIGGWRSNSVNETARWVDGRQKLQERLSTALELSQGNGSENWRQLLVSDAASHLKDLDPRQLVKFSLPRASRWALVLLALAAGLGFVPEYRSAKFKQVQVDRKVIEDAGRHLVELTKRHLENRPPALETTQKSMEAVNELGQQFTQKAVTRSEALKDINNLADRLKDEMKDMAKDPTLRRMEQAARSRNNQNSTDVERLQKQIEEAQKQLGNPTGTPEEMDKLNNALSKLQAAAKAAADKGLSQSEKEQMAQSLMALSKQAQEMGMHMPNLDQAIQALASNQTDMFLKDLDAATTDLEKVREMAKDLQQMQKQMEKIGKDLAEQLQNGQPEAAAATLQKMIKDLKSASLSPEKMDQMMNEVSKALDPASHYGKVAEHLKQGAGQMKAGQKPGAADSLAKAADELQKLMDQMNDAQAMLSELDALNKASMCIASGQCWGQCQGTKISTGPGGKPGRGVGTWADEGAWGYNGEQTGLWDNSGLTRADQDPRGISDRGDGELNDALKPTKVKGQFSPGGQMPSITLKGVSIKGTSKVQLEEATSTAYTDAQSALSQDKVPRAYQGAVRDYFDDFKDSKK